MRKLSVLALTVGLFLTSYIFFRAIFAVTDKSADSQTQTITPPVEIADRVLWSLIQKWRKDNGFVPYIEDKRLCEIAEDRSDDEYDNHEGFLAKYDNANYPYVMQENLVQLYFPKYMLEAWLKSPPHRSTLEKPYTHSCVRCNKHCVQIFAYL